MFYLNAMKNTWNDKEEKFYERQEFMAIDFTETPLKNWEFYKCKFDKCIFSNCDLSNTTFEDCTFDGCDFSMAVVKNTGFRSIVFTECKLLGVNFALCSKLQFSFKFEKCNLNYAIFLGRNLKKTPFIECSLKEADFSDADLSECKFTQSDLTLTRFSNTNLEKTDFRGAMNFSIEPEFNKMKKAKFNLFQLEALLYKYQLDID